MSTSPPRLALSHHIDGRPTPPPDDLDDEAEICRLTVEYWPNRNHRALTDRVAGASRSSIAASAPSSARAPRAPPPGRSGRRGDPSDAPRTAPGSDAASLGSGRATGPLGRPWRTSPRTSARSTHARTGRPGPRFAVRRLSCARSRASDSVTTGYVPMLTSRRELAGRPVEHPDRCQGGLGQAGGGCGDRPARSGAAHGRELAGAAAPSSPGGPAKTRLAPGLPVRRALSLALDPPGQGSALPAPDPGQAAPGSARGGTGVPTASRCIRRPSNRQWWEACWRRRPCSPGRCTLRSAACRVGSGRFVAACAWTTIASTGGCCGQFSGPPSRRTRRGVSNLHATPRPRAGAPAGPARIGSMLGKTGPSEGVSGRIARCSTRTPSLSR